LLLELNNVDGIGNVDNYVGMVVFEVQMKKLKDFTKSFEEFRHEAEEYFNQVQTKAELIDENEVPVNLKFIEYVPAYETKQAYNKFKLHKEPKSPKWLKTRSGEYPETIFACMVKNDDLGQENKNKWMLFNSVIPAASELIGNVIIANHKKIQSADYNLKNTTIRVFNVQEESIDVGMFQEKQKQIFLSDLDDKKEAIIISTDLGEFKVVGVKYQSNANS
jgi:type III restriction enzyme